MTTPATELLSRALQKSVELRFADAEVLLRQAFADEPALAGGHRAYLADILRRGADLQNLTHLAPFRLNTLVHSGWLNSLVHSRPVSADGEPIPWFTYPSIDFLEPKITPHWKVLEWGSGSSTHWWAKRVSSVLSVEHDPAWHRNISAKTPPNTRVVLAEIEQDYVGIETGETRFDAIVIDGLHRNRCARRAHDLAKPAAIIVFDNSDRQEVRDGLCFLRDHGWKRIDFFGLLPAYLYRTCTSIFYRDDATVSTGPLPCDVRTSLGPTCAQVLGE